MIEIKSSSEKGIAVDMYFLTVSIILLYLSGAPEKNTAVWMALTAGLSAHSLEPRSLRSRCCRLGFIQGLLGLHVAALLLPLHVVVPLCTCLVSVCANLLFV